MKKNIKIKILEISKIERQSQSPYGPVHQRGNVIQTVKPLRVRQSNGGIRVVIVAGELEMMTRSLRQETETESEDWNLTDRRRSQIPRLFRLTQAPRRQLS